MKNIDKQSIDAKFAQVARLHYSCFHSYIASEGLLPGQPRMLLYISHNQGATQKDLSDLLKVKPASTTIMIQNLEREGLVEKRADDNDMRKSRIYLSEKGAEAIEKVERMMENIERICFGNFSYEEQQQFKAFLDKMEQNLVNEVQKTGNV